MQSDDIPQSKVPSAVKGEDETKSPLTGDEKEALAKSEKVSRWLSDHTNRLLREGCEHLTLFCITAAVMGVDMYYSPLIVFGVLAFSLCTCAYIPVMNLPLYASVLWLIIQGWAITQGHVKLVWSGAS